uniref:Uncharacterized protein n=1 Tax=Daphnia galeata TaxID=27404 RepID=A0A8J2RNI1_9CRUS|nr:unnamed protein product [Daphnia galeata]
MEGRNHSLSDSLASNSSNPKLGRDSASSSRGSAIKSVSSSTSASNGYFPDFDSKVTIKEPPIVYSPTPLLTGGKSSRSCQRCNLFVSFHSTSEGSANCQKLQNIYFHSSYSRFILDVALGEVIEKRGGASSGGEKYYQGPKKICVLPTNRKIIHTEMYSKNSNSIRPSLTERGLFAFDFKEEYSENVAVLKRQGLHNKSWRISKLNENYDWAVPATAFTDEDNSDMCPLFGVTVVYQ